MSLFCCLLYIVVFVWNGNLFAISISHFVRHLQFDRQYIRILTETKAKNETVIPTSFVCVFKKKTKTFTPPQVVTNAILRAQPIGFIPEKTVGPTRQMHAFSARKSIANRINLTPVHSVIMFVGKIWCCRNAPTTPFLWCQIFFVRSLPNANYYQLSLAFTHECIRRRFNKKSVAFCLRFCSHIKRSDLLHISQKFNEILCERFRLHF